MLCVCFQAEQQVSQAAAVFKFCNFRSALKALENRPKLEPAALVRLLLSKLMFSRPIQWRANSIGKKLTRRAKALRARATHTHTHTPGRPHIVAQQALVCVCRLGWLGGGESNKRPFGCR